jgi:mxaL protein
VSRPWLEIGVRVLALALCLAALLRPGVPIEQTTPRALVVLDVTQSMNARDVVLDGRATDRLAFAKAATARAIDAQPCGAEIGLGVFTEYRTYVLLLPLEVCAHRAELQATLANIDGRLAWAGASEVAKGLNWALRAARGLDPRPAVFFVTDGHEAPPINPRHRPRFDGEPGDVPGAIVGVGGDLPVPIPKLDVEGHPLGVWGADEVAQSDPFSAGRTGSVAGERLVETEDTPIPQWHRVGNEHLTALREPYLQALAAERGLGYARLTTPEALARALALHGAAGSTSRPLDLTPWLLAAAVALLLLAEIAPRVAARWRGRRRSWPRRRVHRRA